MASGRRVAGAIRSLVNARSWKEKERSSIRAGEMDNLRGFLGIRRMDKFRNVWLREFGREIK